MTPELFSGSDNTRRRHVVPPPVGYPESSPGESPGGCVSLPYVRIHARVSLGHVNIFFIFLVKGFSSDNLKQSFRMYVCIIVLRFSEGEL